MSKSGRSHLHYLEDILLSITRIQEYISGHDAGTFEKDYKTTDAVIRNFEVIGEASKNLPKELKAQHTEVPWEEMYRLRNRITHAYFGIDYEIIWNIASQYLPENYEAIKRIIVKIKKENQ